MYKKNMKNIKNKGFTLIELIVVIAIIAVLAVVLAPQYIQYVERGRESNDIQIAQNLMDAAATAAADPSLSSPAASYTINYNSISGGYTVSPNGDAFETVMNAIVPNTIAATQSVQGKTDTLEIVINTQTGSITAYGTDIDTTTGWEALIK